MTKRISQYLNRRGMSNEKNRGNSTGFSTLTYLRTDPYRSTAGRKSQYPLSSARDDATRTGP